MASMKMMEQLWRWMGVKGNVTYYCLIAFRINACYICCLNCRLHNHASSYFHSSPPINEANTTDYYLKCLLEKSGVNIPPGKQIQAKLHLKPTKEAMVKNRRRQEPRLVDLSSKCDPLAAKLFPNSLKMKSDLYG